MFSAASGSRSWVASSTSSSGRIGDQSARHGQPLLHAVRVDAHATSGGVGEAHISIRHSGRARERGSAASPLEPARRRGDSPMPDNRR